MVKIPKQEIEQKIEKAAKRLGLSITGFKRLSCLRYIQDFLEKEEAS